MSHPCSFRRDVAFTLVELLVVIGLLALLIGVLLPVLSRVRTEAYKASVAREWSGSGAYAPQQNAGEDASRPAAAQAQQGQPGSPPPQVPRIPLARVTKFAADIGLTPKLSVGTTEPESIYEATFSAKIEATRPAGAGGEGECELPLPLPPQIISLSGLIATIDGKPSTALTIRDNQLVWHGQLAAADAAQPAKLEVTFDAVGKGLYELRSPPGDVIDEFQINLTAHGSDVRMLELSLQPTTFKRASEQTTYTWNYPRLMFGRPIALDVLGIAPIDRLGELRWLGPLSVILFGMLVGLIANAYKADRFDRWTLLLVLGTFTAAYPLMYFAQEFVSLRLAITASAGAAMLIIAVRSVTVMPLRVALFGLVIPGAIVMSVTLAAALKPQLQGLLLTAEAMAFFVLAMVLMPLEAAQTVPPQLATA
jgi:hypothetical protein